VRPLYHPRDSCCGLRWLLIADPVSSSLSSTRFPKLCFSFVLHDFLSCLAVNVQALIDCSFALTFQANWPFPAFTSGTSLARSYNLPSKSSPFPQRKFLKFCLCPPPDKVLISRVWFLPFCVPSRSLWFCRLVDVSYTAPYSLVTVWDFRICIIRWHTDRRVRARPHPLALCTACHAWTFCSEIFWQPPKNCLSDLYVSSLICFKRLEFTSPPLFASFVLFFPLISLYVLFPGVPGSRLFFGHYFLSNSWPDLLAFCSHIRGSSLFKNVPFSFLHRCSIALDGGYTFFYPFPSRSYSTVPRVCPCWVSFPLYLLLYRNGGVCLCVGDLPFCLFLCPRRILWFPTFSPCAGCVLP